MGRIVICLLTAFLILPSVCRSQPAKTATSVSSQDWGQVNGKDIKLFTLRNSNRMELKVTNYGGTITGIMVPDLNDSVKNVTIGNDSLQSCINDRGYHGKTTGRYHNRIGNAQFTLNGVTYKLTPNNGANLLHGGKSGFSNQVFDIDSVWSAGDSAVVALRYFSPDMEEGFPGNLTLSVKFVLTSDNEVEIFYEAVTDKPTVAAFSNHSYFNLTGFQGSVLDHRVRINANSITETPAGGIPTGNLTPVAGTMYDFRTPATLREKLSANSRGYDINYVLNKQPGKFEWAAELYDPASGRLLEAYTTEPGLQLFTMQNSVCMEAQHFPDSPNKPEFPGVVLSPGEKYRQFTVYKFSVVRDYRK
jgi:aldose 1-epimerase